MATRKQPRRWVDFALEPYPIAATTTYRWAKRPYGGSQFIEGRVAEWEAIERSASSMSGEPSVDHASVMLLDLDGQIRALLDGVTTQWFLKREGTFKLLSEAGYLAGLTPRILLGGRCTDAQLADNRRARLEFEDLLAPYLDRTYPQYTLGDAYPYRFTEEEFVEDAEPGTNIPTELRDQVMPIYYGPFVDTATDPVTGTARQKGMIPTFFMGFTRLTGGTADEPPPEAAAIIGNPGWVENWGGWGELFVCLGEVDIPNVYTSDLQATPKRVLNTDDIGVTIYKPGGAGWPHATNYVIRNGFRCTVIYVRGPLLHHHVMGMVNITVDVCGWKNASGVAIDQAGFAWQDFTTQHVLAHDGAGYTSGPSVGLPTYADGRAMFWTSQIQNWQAMTARRLGNSRGYLISMPLTKPTTLREIRRTFNVTFDCFDAKNAAGQLYLFGINDLADPETGVPIRERIELTHLPAPRIAWDEIENEITYTIGWDPEQDTPRTIEITTRRQNEIDAMQGDVRNKGVRHMKYTADDYTARDVVGRRARRLCVAPRYQPLPVRTEGVDREIGEQVRVSHRDGFGPAGVGYNLRPMVNLKHRHVGDAVTLEALEVERILETAISAPATTGGGGWDWYTWPASL